MDKNSLADSKSREAKDVSRMFGRIAPSYDKINRAMCFGLDVLWRKKLVRAVGNLPLNARILDCACGSGDVVLELARHFHSAEIVGADFCREMLEIAEVKAAEADLSERVKFLPADCAALPFKDGEFDAVTIAFGFRNFKDRRACLKEIARILRSGGTLAILEVARAEGIFAPAQKIFMGRFVPAVASIFGGVRADYEYLAKTTLEYPANAEVARMIESAGFAAPEIEKLGCGLVAIVSAVKR